MRIEARLLRTPGQLVYEKGVNEVRTNLGRILARGETGGRDVVVPVPDSGVCAAMGTRRNPGFPLRMGLIRNHYVGRTFIQPQSSIRHFGVKVKLNPVRSILDGRRVILVDDSIVRGTTSRKIVRMVRAAGAKEVHVRISCPPTISPCFYGVDTPSRSELIAATHSLDEITGFLDADSVAYLSLEGLLSSDRRDRQNYCSSAIPDSTRWSSRATEVVSAAGPEARQRACYQLSHASRGRFTSPMQRAPRVRRKAARLRPVCRRYFLVLFARRPARARSLPRHSLFLPPTSAAIDTLGDLDYATRTSASRTVPRTAAPQAVDRLLRAVAEHADGDVRYARSSC